MTVYIVMSYSKNLTALHGAFLNKEEAEKQKQYLNQNGNNAWIEPLTVIDYDD